MMNNAVGSKDPSKILTLSDAKKPRTKQFPLIFCVILYLNDTSAHESLLWLRDGDAHTYFTYISCWV